jgi:integrator complex subunit 11
MKDYSSKSLIIYTFTDAKGIMQLIRNVEPRHVMFVHGEDAKMEFLKQKVEKEFGIPVFKPANGETISVPTCHDFVLEVPEELVSRSIGNCLDPAKTNCPFQAYIIVNKEVKTKK